MNRYHHHHRFKTVSMISGRIDGWKNKNKHIRYEHKAS